MFRLAQLSVSQMKLKKMKDASLFIRGIVAVCESKD